MSHKAHCLGEKSPAINEVAMEQETDGSSATTVREESQDSMAEIRKIISTPIEVSDAQEDEDMPQQEQETKEQEVTITGILEEINKSSSSKSNNSMREEQSNEPGLNNTQSSEGNFVINDTMNQQSKDIIQEEAITTASALQSINSSELLIPREDFTLIEEHGSLEEIMIYDMVV